MIEKIPLEKKTVKLELREEMLEAVRLCQRTYGLKTHAETVRHALVEYLQSRGFYQRAEELK